MGHFWSLLLDAELILKAVLSPVLQVIKHGL